MPVEIVPPVHAVSPTSESDEVGEMNREETRKRTYLREAEAMEAAMRKAMETGRFGPGDDSPLEQTILDKAAKVGVDYSEVCDSGVREDFPTGSQRDTRAGKGRYDLLPAYAIGRLARHYENGARKYRDRNWEKGQPVSRYLDSALRHQFRWLDGSRGEDHLAAAVWNLLAIIETQERVRLGRLPAGLDDLPSP